MDKEYFVYRVISVNSPICHLCVQAENREGKRVCFAAPRFASPSNKEGSKSGIKEGDTIYSSWIQAYSCTFINDCEYQGINPQPILDNYKLIEDKLNRNVHDWVKSDDFQYIKHIGNGFYDCIEARIVADNCYNLCQSIVNINSYMNTGDSGMEFNEDGQDIIKTYYSSLEEFDYDDADFKKQCFAEMVFEETPEWLCKNYKEINASEDVITSMLEAYVQGASFSDSIRSADTVEERDY